MAMVFNTGVTLNASKVLKFNTINIPTASSGSTYGAGSNGQILKSNGTTVYWANDNNTTYSTMSLAEAVGGTDTNDRLIRSDRMAAAIKRQAVVKVVLSSITSLPKTYTVTGLTANHEVTEYQLSNPNAQAGDWTVTTAANSLTLSGTFNGSTATNVTMYLGIPETITATAT